jgi:nitrate reductase gamma subunit
MAAAVDVEKGKPELIEPDLGLIEELAHFGADTFNKCYQCATCSVSCALSPDENPFPRKEMLWAKWGLKEKLLKDVDIWTCYYCGDCSTRCPRKAEPGETMMALRRWLTSQYDWTGISRALYTSRVREIGAVVGLGLLVVVLFALSGAFTAERMPTDAVSVNTFIPVEWVHAFDLVMAAVLTFFLLTNTARMWRFVMEGVNAPISAYITGLKTFVIHAVTQKRWRDCEKKEDNSRWLKHFIFVPAYVAMFTLVMFFLEDLQVDTSEFTAVSLLGYVIAAILLYVSGDALISRIQKREELHKHSHDSDWMFLILLFFTSLTGILMHFFRISDWAMGTYYMYVIHMAFVVPLLVLEVPFMKWAHLMYRPLAMYLKEVKDSTAAAKAA